MKYFNDDYANTVQQAAVLPRYRTIRECVVEIKNIDEHTAITECFIRRLCKQGKVQYFANGSKSLVSLDSLLSFLGYADKHNNKENNNEIRF